MDFTTLVITHTHTHTNEEQLQLTKHFQQKSLVSDTKTQTLITWRTDKPCSYFQGILIQVKVCIKVMQLNKRVESEFNNARFRFLITTPRLGRLIAAQ